MLDLNRRRIAALSACAGVLLSAAAGWIWLRPARSEAAPSVELAALKADFERPQGPPPAAQDRATAARIALGRQLFFDTRFSGSGRMSCATCHDPARGWGDGKARSVGDTGIVAPRRSPSIVDVAWGGPYFWDGRAETLEAQARGPLSSPVEMNFSLERARAAVAASPDYRTPYRNAYPGRPVTIALITRAIADFERTVASPQAPFDRWIAGDEGAMSTEAKRGFVLFNGKAGCAACHSGWRFTDDGFHDIGLDTTDLGRGAVDPTNPLMKHAMKTPTLRNVGQRAPYMHDGSIATLEAVIGHYDAGGVVRASRSPEVKPLGLTPDERQRLLAFLQSLDAGPAPAAGLRAN